MFSMGEKHKGKFKGRWHYLAVKKLSALLREISAKMHHLLFMQILNV